MIKRCSIVNYYKVIFVFTLVSSTAFSTTDRELRESAWKKDTGNQHLKYQWATIAPCTTALRLYKEIADSSSAPDSLRGKSYGALGEYYYSIKNYTKASQLFQSATKLSKSALYRNFRALSLYQTGNYETARSLWVSLASENKKEYGLIADYHTGLIFLKQGKFAAACSSFIKCGAPDSLKPLTIEALSAKYFCAGKLGYTEDVKRYKVELLPYKSVASINWASFINQSAVVVPDTEIESPVNKTITVDKDAYTIQVGAFGSKDNADLLQKKLVSLFNNVTVATVTLDDKVFYRVRVGTFATREQADLFAADSVQKAGYNGKVVPQ